jgi:hypothetical protein
MTITDVTQAVFSLKFPTCSAGGPDGLRPQHLKDLVTHSLSEGSDSFLVSLTEFINRIIQGKVPQRARPFFFGAGLSKKDRARGLGQLLLAVFYAGWLQSACASLFLRKWAPYCSPTNLVLGLLWVPKLQFMLLGHTYPIYMMVT